MDLGELLERSLHRKCMECGEEFETDKNWQTGGMTAMQKHVDHLATHNYSPDQWTTASSRIQEWKSRKKESKGD